MLKLCYRMQEVNFSALMAVYAESNGENGRENWPRESAGMQQLLAEQDFRQYLREVFFQTPGAAYAIWEVKGKYVSALRLEHYRDGLLLAGLETAPEYRRQGFAAKLVASVVGEFAGEKIYSHISKRNAASIAVHERCGFQKVMNHAVYVDGSVSHRAATYLIQT